MSEMKEFGDLHFTVESGFAQRSGVYELTTAIDPEESKVIPRNLERTGQPSGRVFPFSSDEETVANSEVLGEQNSPQRHAAQNSFAAKPTRLAPYERSTGGVRFTESVLSKKVLDALSEDIDPAKSLADIRRVLVGPTRRLHEARMEEVISILEESDRAAQQALGALEKRFLDLARTSEKLMAASDEKRLRPGKNSIRWATNSPSRCVDTRIGLTSNRPFWRKLMILRPPNAAATWSWQPTTSFIHPCSSSIAISASFW